MDSIPKKLEHWPYPGYTLYQEPRHAMFDDWKNLKSLVGLMRYRAERSGPETSLTWYTNGEEAGDRITYTQLWEQARSIGAAMQAHGLKVGDTALCLYGYDDAIKFAASLWACFCSGIAAVPSYPPENDSGFKKTALIAKDCGASVVLTTGAWAKKVAPDAGMPQLVLTVDGLDHAEQAKRWTEPRVDWDTVAFLQYTSGSTGAPKGVQVTHGNVFFDCKLQLEGHGTPEGSQLASWLPFFHTFGLVATYCMTVYACFQYHLMSPGAFVAKPLRYLEILSRQRCAMCASANFSLDLMCARVTEEQVRALDLSHLRTIFVGGEPVRAASVDRFIKKFEPAGLRPTVIMPGLGMSECTCVVTIYRPDAAYHSFTFSARSLERGKAVRVPEDSPDARRLVSNGRCPLDDDLAPMRIVDPVTRRRCRDGDIGEIWVAGPHVCYMGYRGRPKETEETFRGRMDGPDDDGRFYLRTGDLAFFDQEHHELYIMGRCKEIIIINGANHHPIDIENTVAANCPVPGVTVAAFGIEVGGSEQLVVLVEPPAAAPQALITAAKATVGKILDGVRAVHELQPFTIAFLPPNLIARSGTGKVMRTACRTNFMNGTYRSAATLWWSVDSGFADEQSSHAEEAAAKAEEKALASMSDSARALALHTVKTICATSSTWSSGARKPRITSSFTELGLNSIDMMSIAAELGTHIGKQVNASMIYKYPTIELLSRFLAGESLAAAQTGNEMDIHVASSEECLNLFKVGVSEGWSYNLEDAEIISKVCPKSCIAITVNGKWAGGYMASYWPEEKYDEANPKEGFGWMCMYYAVPELRDTGAGTVLGQHMGSGLKKGITYGACSVNHMLETYKIAGFVPYYNDMYYWQDAQVIIDQAPALAVGAATIVDAKTIDIEKIHAYDRQVFPWERRKMVREWVMWPSHTSLAALNSNGDVIGYSVVRKAPYGQLACPLYVDNKATAAAMLLTFAKKFPDFKIGFAMNPTNEGAAQIVEQLRFQKNPGDEECTRVYLNGRPPIEAEQKKVFGGFRVAFSY